MLFRPFWKADWKHIPSPSKTTLNWITVSFQLLHFRDASKAGRGLELISAKMWEKAKARPAACSVSGRTLWPAVLIHIREKKLQLGSQTKQVLFRQGERLDQVLSTVEQGTVVGSWDTSIFACWEKQEVTLTDSLQTPSSAGYTWETWKKPAKAEMWQTVPWWGRGR